jgi:arabinose-5-phosphate isomerase
VDIRHVAGYNPPPGEARLLRSVPGPSLATVFVKEDNMTWSASSAAAQTASHKLHRSPLEIGQAVVRQEARALWDLAELLGDSFVRAVELLHKCRGSVIVSGMGKAGLIGRKVAATLASTGTRSHFLHPAEAIHGDLGRIHTHDLVLLLSQSGTTEEVLRLLPSLQNWQVPIIAITGQLESPLAQVAQVTLWIGNVQEAGSLQLAPSTSTTAMLALGDALALAVSERRGFTSADFAKFHPGGALGRQLARVEDCMRPLAQCRITCESAPLRESLVRLSQPGRRSGAILVTDPAGILCGIFTDSDLARLLESQREHLLDQPIAQVMTSSPTTVTAGTMMAEAIGLLSQRKISELPVVDANGLPLGVVDITDVVAFMPREQTATPPDAPVRLRVFDPPNRTTASHVDETRRTM